MEVTVVTGFSPTGYEQYGKRFLETFDRYWPKSVDLLVYAEEEVPVPRGEFRDLFSIEGCASFIESYRDDPAANGLMPSLSWKQKEIEGGYSFRFDAWKFCRQGFIPFAAAQGRTGILIWLDADVVTFAPVPEGFAESLVSAPVAYLGRAPKHSEIGFMGFRLPEALPVLERFRDHYATGSVFSLREWHSAYVFDRALMDSGVASVDLTPGGSGHVWRQSPLAAYTEHLKGPARKARGYVGDGR